RRGDPVQPSVLRLPAATRGRGDRCGNPRPRSPDPGLDEGPRTVKTVEIRHLAEVWTSSVDKHTLEGELPVQLCNYTDAYKRDRVRPAPGLMRATATTDEIRRNRLRVGDSVFTKDSEDPQDIGISAFVDAEAEDFVCGYHLAIARPFED